MCRRLNKQIIPATEVNAAERGKEQMNLRGGGHPGFPHERGKCEVRHEQEDVKAQRHSGAHITAPHRIITSSPARQAWRLSGSRRERHGTPGAQGG